MKNLPSLVTAIHSSYIIVFIGMNNSHFHFPYLEFILYYRLRFHSCDTSLQSPSAEEANWSQGKYKGSVGQSGDGVKGKNNYSTYKNTE